MLNSDEMKEEYRKLKIEEFPKKIENLYNFLKTNTDDPEELFKGKVKILELEILNEILLALKELKK